MPLSQVDQAKYKALYIQTARQYVEELQKNCITLQNSPEDSEALATVHRAVHSLTSQSRIMDYNQIASVASVLEKFFKQTIDAKKSVSSEQLTTITQVVSSMASDVDAIEKNNAEISLATEAEKVQAWVIA